PAPCSRYLHDQPADVQAFQDPADGGAVATALRVTGAFGVESRANVLIAESLGDVIASQYRSEQAGFVLPSRVEARVAAALVALSFRQLLQVGVARCWVC